MVKLAVKDQVDRTKTLVAPTDVVQKLVFLLFHYVFGSTTLLYGNNCKIICVIAAGY